MATIVRDRQFNFRVNSELLNQAKEVLKQQDMTLSDALNLFVEQIAANQELPIKTKEEMQAESFLADLTADLNKGYEDVLAGRTKPAHEVFAKYDL